MRPDVCETHVEGRERKKKNPLKNMKQTELQLKIDSNFMAEQRAQTKQKYFYFKLIFVVEMSVVEKEEITLSNYNNSEFTSNITSQIQNHIL